MAAEVPTFKLVLVGDGGTGKVRTSDPPALREEIRMNTGKEQRLTIIPADHLRQAPLDW